MARVRRWVSRLAAASAGESASSRARAQVSGPVAKRRGGWTRSSGMGSQTPSSRVADSSTGTLNCDLMATPGRSGQKCWPLRSS